MANFGVATSERGVEHPAASLRPHQPPRPPSQHEQGYSMAIAPSSGEFLPCYLGKWPQLHQLHWLKDETSSFSTVTIGLASSNLANWRVLNHCERMWAQTLETETGMGRHDLGNSQGSEKKVHFRGVTIHPSAGSRWFGACTLSSMRNSYNSACESGPKDQMPIRMRKLKQSGCLLDVECLRYVWPLRFLWFLLGLEWATLWVCHLIQPSEAIEPKKVGSGTSGVCSSWWNKMK